MNLKQKRLMGFPVGTLLTLHYSGGTFTGFITEKDEESLVVSSDAGSICLDYTDVSLYVEGDNNSLLNNFTPSPGPKPGPKPANELPKKEKFVPAFMTDVIQPELSDSTIKRLLEDVEPDNKKFVIDRFNSIMYSIKNNNKDKAKLTLKTLVAEIKNDNQADSDKNLWKLVARIAMRLSEHKSEYSLKGDCFEDAAIYYFEKQKYDFAGLFSALAICCGKNLFSLNEMYTIAFVSCKKNDDVSGVIEILKSNKHSDYDMQLLRGVCSHKNKECSDNSNIAFKINEIKSDFKVSVIGNKYREVVEGYSLNTPALPKPEKQETEIIKNKTGQIVKLQWSKEEGHIEYKGSGSTGSIVFKYDSISEDELKDEISTIYTSNVENKDLYVLFDIQNDTAINIRKNKAASLQDRKFDGKMQKLSSMNIAEILKEGRAIIANSAAGNRFDRALTCFEYAIEKDGPKEDILAEIYNCCLALNNSAADSASGKKYIEKALGYYRQFESSVRHDLKYDVTGLGIINNYGNFEEKTALLKRLIAYSSLAVQQKLYYISCLGDAYFKQGDLEGNSAYLENACEEYLHWENEFYSHPIVYSTPAYINTYYTKILVNYAKSLIALGNKKYAEHIVSKIRVHDPKIGVLAELDAALGADIPDFSDYHTDGEKSVVYTEDIVPEEEENEALYKETDIITEAADEDADSDEGYDIDNMIAYVDVDDPSALGLTAENIMKYVLNLKGECAHVYSLTYLQAAAAFDKRIAGYYDALSIALDEPFHEHGYSADEIISAFNEREEQYAKFFDFCFAAAALRSIFCQSGGTDYLIDSLCAMVSVASEYPELKALIDILSSFKKRFGKGMDVFAPYRLLNKDEQEIRLNQVLSRAKALYQQNFEVIFHESTNQLRFKLTKAYIYKKNEELEVLLRHIKENDTEYFKENREKFEKTFIRPDSSISRDNISDSKIDAFIDVYWARAGASDKIAERKTSDLMGGLRNNLRVRIKEIVAVVCDWAELCDNGNTASEDSFDKHEFARLSPEAAELAGKLINSLSAADETDSPDTVFGKNILAVTLKEIKDKLTGQWNASERKYYYADFLSTNYILLDNNFRPDITSSFCSLADFNIFARLRAHFDDSEKSLQKNYETIFSRNQFSNNFGTAALIEEYANECEIELNFTPSNPEMYTSVAENKLKLSYKRFVEDIQLANGKGQIMLSDEFMNSVNDTALYWYSYCLNSKNYGFFFEFIEACKQKIYNEAKIYEETLMAQFEAMTEKSPELFQSEEVKEQLAEQIKSQNFLVAEDWMNRLRRGDFYNTSDGSDEPFDAIETLNKFWKEYSVNFDASKDSGINLSLQVSRGGHIPAKDKKGGLALISSWLLNGKPSTASKMKTLLNGLGWDDIDVSDVSTSRQELYKVKYNRSFAGNKVYQHPFAAFGTACAFSGFYAACIYGYYNADRIIDKFKELDSTPGNKVVLLDFALSASERRTLARKIKETILANTYILVDRVAVLYVANHYVSGSNNRTLMAITMPFSYAQPYVVESSQDMPPEMFIGRKEELLSIESPSGANLIFGGRQLGKSALLKKAKKDIDDPASERRAVFLDMRGTDYIKAARKISCELVDLDILPKGSETDSWDELERAVINRLRNNENPITYLLLLLDEADTLIKSSESVEYLPIAKLKNIQQSSEGKFKFVLAGLHNLVRFNRDVALGNNSVITHIANINIKPFKYDDARQLLTKPLSYLGFSFENDDVLISQILAATNYFPGLIQLYCKKLIEAMKNNYAEYNEAETPPYKVSETHIKKVLSDAQFREQIKEKFEATLELDSDDGGYYYFVALLIALIEENTGFKKCSPELIASEAKKCDIKAIAALGKDSLKAILDELCCLNILMTDADGDYGFSTKNFRDMMGSREDIEEKLLSLIGKGESL